MDLGDGEYDKVFTFVQELLLGNIVYRYSSICDTRDSIYRYAIDKICIKSNHEYVE